MRDKTTNAGRYRQAKATKRGGKKTGCRSSFIVLRNLGNRTRPDLEEGREESENGADVAKH